MRADVSPHRARVPIVLTALVIALLAAVSGCGRGRTAAGEAVVLDLWHVWGGEQAAAIDEVVAAFEAAHPGVHVNPVFTRNDLASSQKFFTAVAANDPPDVIFVDGPQVAPWAEWGALEPLDDRLTAADIRPEDYFDPCWGQCTYEGRTWALTYCADPNFGFVWNKDRFREAGLDPSAPPRTIEELAAMAEALTVRGEGGDLATIGFIPWAQYGSANSVFTWGWAFGGSFYDPETRTVTADDPRIVRALTWMIEYCDRFDARKISALEAGFGTAEQDPFYTGKMAMRCLHIGGIVDIGKYAPDLDWGVAFIPPPAEGGEGQSSWVGGWCMAIPKGCEHPDEAFELIRWLCHDPAGTLAGGEASGLFPGVKDAPYFERVKGEPYYGAFLDIIQACKHQRPVMPSQAFFMRELDRAVDAARFGKIAPPKSVELVGSGNPDWWAGIAPGLAEKGVPVTLQGGGELLDINATGPDAAELLPREPRENVLAITAAAQPMEGADGFLPAPVDAGDILRWWTAKRALATARENTQRELDLILKGSE